VRQLRLIKPVSWMAVAAVIGGVVAAVLIASR
jgi:type II secretory pathway component PulF